MWESGLSLIDLHKASNTLLPSAREVTQVQHLHGVVRIAPGNAEDTGCYGAGCLLGTGRIGHAGSVNDPLVGYVLLLGHAIFRGRKLVSSCCDILIAILPA